MIFEILNQRPSQKKMILLLVCGLIGTILSLPIMNHFFELSKYPVSFFESQLSFSGQIIKSHFATMSLQELNYYTIGQLADYGFIISNALIKFSLAVLLARTFSTNSTLRYSGFITAILGILGSLFDAIENIFIFLMIGDPTGFNDWLAVIHSVFALVKYILTFIVYGWIFIALIFVIKNQISSQAEKA